MILGLSLQFLVKIVTISHDPLLLQTEFAAIIFCSVQPLT